MIKNFLKQIVIFLLKIEAMLILRKYKPKIVAVSGTVGKTSTKDAIALVLSGVFNARKSEKSYNSEIGVPLTIIGVQSAWNNFLQWILVLFAGAKIVISKEKYPEWLAIELGVDRPGDMEKLMKWISPDVAVITALGEIPVHIEYFRGADEVAKEKAKLIQKLKQGDYAILNGDDMAVLALREKTKANVITFGFSEMNDLVASNYRVSPDGITFKVDYKGNIIPVRLFNLYGRHYVYSALAAIGVGISQGLNLIEMAETLSKFNPPPGRLNLLEGIKKTFILDDSYNSSPLAAAAALDALNELPAQRKIAVLGDMLELGKFTIDEHKKVGRKIKEMKFDLLFTVGPRSKFLAEEALAAGFNPKKIFEFSTSDEAKKIVQEKIQEGDLILIKGSQSMRMEKIVEEIMLHPELKERLLVRQEKEWQNR